MHPRTGTPLVQLAPMEGVLDWVLRDCLSEVGGFDRMVTEFVRVTERLLPAHVFYKYCPELETGGATRSGTPVFVQLLGGQPGPMAENAAFVAELGAPGVDLNFGCPAKTVNRHDGGAALLREPRRVYDVTRAVRDAVRADVPVTVKVRLGFDHKEFHREIAQAADEAGADHLVVHARTKAEMYTPPAHWQYIASMREGRALPFLANGEIWSVEDYHRCVKACGVRAVALGRGVVRRPTLAREIQALHAEVKPEWPAFEPVEFLHRFFQANLQSRGAAFAVARLKQILRYWSVADSRGLEWFNQAKLFRGIDEVEAFFIKISREEHTWQPFNSTPGEAVPTASALKIC